MLCPLEGGEGKLLGGGSRENSQERMQSQLLWAAAGASAPGVQDCEGQCYSSPCSAPAVEQTLGTCVLPPPATWGLTSHLPALAVDPSLTLSSCVEGAQPLSSEGL